MGFQNWVFIQKLNPYPTLYKIRSNLPLKVHLTLLSSAILLTSSRNVSSSIIQNRIKRDRERYIQSCNYSEIWPRLEPGPFPYMHNRSSVQDGCSIFKFLFVTISHPLSKVLYLYLKYGQGLNRFPSRTCIITCLFRMAAPYSSPCLSSSHIHSPSGGQIR